jgi:hypothetical protein
MAASRSCRTCQNALEIECDMEWLWTPLIVLPPVMSIFLLACLSLPQLWVMACLVCIVLSFFIWISLSTGIITPWCCNCAYSSQNMLFFIPGRMIWRMSACQKCRNVRASGRKCAKVEPKIYRRCGGLRPSCIFSNEE